MEDRPPISTLVARRLLLTNLSMVLLAVFVVFDLLFLLLLVVTPWVTQLTDQLALYFVALGTSVYAAFHFDETVRDWLEGVAEQAPQILPRASETAPALSTSSDETPRAKFNALTHPHRLAFWERIQTASRQIDEHTQRMPHEGLRPISAVLAEQQRQLLPETRAALGFADWLQEQAHGLEQRSRNPENIAALEDVRERIADIDLQAQHVAELLERCEASLLATLSRQMVDRDTVERLNDIAGLFEDQQRIVHQLAESDAQRPSLP